MKKQSQFRQSRGARRWCALGSVSAVAVLGVVTGMPSASAAQPSVGLGKATSFAVLAGTTITNTGATKITGDIGVSPYKAITGFPPGKVVNGAQHKADSLALQAKNDLVTGYNDAAGRTPVTVAPADLGGKTLNAGVYKASSALGLTGTVTLNAAGDAGAVFVFQAGSTLITSSSSKVRLTGGAQACNVFWQVGSSATLGTTSTFVGSVMALTSVTVKTGATVAGRVLARNGQVSLDTNTITRPTCAAASAASASPVATATPTATAGASPTATAPGGGTPTGVPAGSGGLAAAAGSSRVDLAVAAGVLGAALLLAGAYGASRRRGR